MRIQPGSLVRSIRLLCYSEVTILLYLYTYTQAAFGSRIRTGATLPGTVAGFGSMVRRLRGTRICILYRLLEAEKYYPPRYEAPTPQVLLLPF